MNFLKIPLKIYLSDSSETFVARSLLGVENAVSYFNKKDFPKLLELANLDNYFFFNGDIFK